MTRSKWESALSSVRSSFSSLFTTDSNYSSATSKERASEGSPVELSEGVGLGSFFEVME
ncbi:MAG: hypothetical protein JXA18_06725 [Chitinispirillaceae bacterium]|nr:hypothetical protein [Chitinispirillaceae bacterium]